MLIRFKSLTLTAAVVAIVMLLGASQRTAAQEAKPAAKPEAKADAKGEKQPAKARGRLPAYYSDVVNKQQREKIYAIQASYDEKIEALEKQLKELQAKMISEVQAVLTPEQQKQVEEYAALAKAKAKSAKEAAAPEKAPEKGVAPEKAPPKDAPKKAAQ